MRLDNLNIKAVYACVGDVDVDNLENCRRLYGEKAEGIVGATGINRKSVCTPGVSSLDLCSCAAKKLLEDLAVEPEKIGAVVNVTFTPANLMPCNACGIQNRLNLPHSVLAFDINLACSGYVYGLYVAGLMARNLDKHVLLLDGDVQTAFLTDGDKATTPVMADAGSATLVDASESNEWKFSFLTDGSLRNMLYIPEGGSECPLSEKSVRMVEEADGSRRRACDINMDGFGVFKFVSVQATGLLLKFMDENQLKAGDIDSFVPHQANVFMVRQMAKRLKIDNDRLMVSADILGNSSSATVPVTMAYNAQLGKFKGGRSLLSGFGGGMSVSIGYGKISEDCKMSFMRYKHDN